MAGTGGYFLKGLAGGIKGLGSQVAEMTWRKREKERIQKEKDALSETMSMTTKKFEDFYTDGTVSDDEKLQARTIYLALAYDTQQLLKGSYDAVMNFNKEAEEQNLATLKAYREEWGSMDFDLSTIPEIYEHYKGQIIGEKGKMLFDACDKKLKKRYEIKQAEPQIERFASPADVTSAYPESTPKHTTQGWIPEFAETKGPKLVDYNTGLKYLKNIINVSPKNWLSAKKRLETEYGLDYSNITQESLRKPEGETKTRATSLPLQEDYKQKALDTNTLKDKKEVVDTYAKAGYNTSEMPTDQEWIDGKLGELDSHVEMLKEITDEEDKLIGGKTFKFLSGDEEESKTGEEWYKTIYEAYIFYLEGLRKMGINVSKYPKIKSPGEIKKTFWGKYPSIYYTGTTPTSTPTETPKLPLTP